MKPQLISYADSLGGDLASLHELLTTELAGVFTGGLHLLPPFPSSGDRGFAPIRYDQIEPDFGDWDDVAKLSKTGPLVLDVMVNHISRQSEAFREFEQKGRASEWADLFITLDKIWPDGKPKPGDLDHVALRKPDNPFSVVTIAGNENDHNHADGAVQTKSKRTETIWTTFGFSGGPVAEQIDLDISSPLALALFDEWFAGLATRGATTLRLDAVGYLTKKPGTRCFMNHPEIWDHLKVLSDIGDRHGLEVLPEVHDGPRAHRDLADRGYLSYDFALPGLVLNAFLTQSSNRLVEHLSASPPNQVTMLDCHDGVGVNPDLRGLLNAHEAEQLVSSCVDRGANLTQVHHDNTDPSSTHQINITFADAIGSDQGFLLARAIQLFAPGLPQIYYVGLLAGRNDHQSVKETGELRAINRHNFDLAEARERLKLPFVRQQLDLIKFRATHPAFEGGISEITQPTPSSLLIRWLADLHWALLRIDLQTLEGSIEASDTPTLELA